MVTRIACPPPAPSARQQRAAAPSPTLQNRRPGALAKASAPVGPRLSLVPYAASPEAPSRSAGETGAQAAEPAKQGASGAPGGATLDSAPPVSLPSGLATTPSTSGRDIPGMESFDEWLEDMETKTSKMRCPFWKRRFTDGLEWIASVATWVGARHKTLSVLAPTRSTGVKQTGLSIEAVAAIIEADFVERQYYVTGGLTKALYTDDCYFDGPDPDVPVIGLSKYCDATANLFDRKLSRVDLLSIAVLDSSRVRATWRLDGALKLPWRPSIKPFLGTTIYTVHESSRLVCRHEETWSITALDAFVSTLLPGYGAPPAPPAASLQGLADIADYDEADEVLT